MSADMPHSVSLRLASAASRVPLGEVPGIVVEATNVGPEAVWLIGVVDGSESGARYPRWSPLVDGPTGRLPPPEQSDFTSPLLPSDFRRLVPGESFDPTSGATFYPLSLFNRISEAPGRYLVSVELDTKAPGEEAWIGTLPDRRPEAAAEAASARRLLADVPRLRVRSNTLMIEVTVG